MRDYLMDHKLIPRGKVSASNLADRQTRVNLDLIIEINL